MMRKIKLFNVCITVTALLFLLPAATVFAGPVYESQDAENYDLIVLTPGHSRTIHYELDDSIGNNIGNIHAAFIVTTGEGTLSVSVANTSSIGEHAEIIYSTVGFIGATPVLNYAYSSGTINFDIDVPAFSVGLLLTGVMARLGDPDFPVTMSMTFFMN